VQFAARQRNDFADRIVDVQPILARLRLRDERANPTDDVAGSSPIADDPIKRLLNLLRVRWLHIEPAQSGLCVGDHRGDRLIDLMSDRGRQLPHGRDAIGVRERLSLFLRPPAFGHIHHGAHEFDHIAGWTENRVADGLDLSDLAVRMHNSIAYVPIYLFADCSLEMFCGSGPVIGMEAPLEFFKSRRPPCGIETQNAERFLRPVGMFAGRRDTRPAARVTQPLRFL
jgi:hypothetical protein